MDGYRERESVAIGLEKSVCQNKAMALPTNIATTNFLNSNFPNIQPSQNCNSTKVHVKPLNCTPIQQQVDSGILCESCNGRGWLLCDFCKGQKTNVRAENNRIYRRCPSCRAVGSILCSKCKVYKCVTFPDEYDGEELNFLAQKCGIKWHFE